MVQLEELDLEDDDDGPPDLELIDGEDAPPDLENINNATEDAGEEGEEEEFVCEKVYKGLYLGSKKAANPQVLLARGITHVFAVGKNLPPTLGPGDADVARTITPTCAAEEVQYVYNKDGLVYMCLEVEDAVDTSLLNYSFGANNFIKEALADDRARVLIMCEDGTSLAPTMLGTFLICERGATVAVALGHLINANPLVNLNKGYQRHLRFLERAGGKLPDWVMPP